MSSSEDKPASKRPADTAFKQQRLPAWQPILSPKWVIGSFLIVGAVFIIIGAVITDATNKLVETEIQYSPSAQFVSNAIKGVSTTTKNDQDIYYPSGNSTFPYYFADTYTIEFQVEKELQPPVYMYYKLENFYQNHRRYVSSRNDIQLMGKWVAYNDLSDCAPLRSRGEFLGKGGNGPSDMYVPCGLIAWSMFNDTFLMTDSQNKVICDGGHPTSTTCKKTGIAWQSDVEKKFQLMSSSNTPVVYNSTYEDQQRIDFGVKKGHVVPSVVDEDLIVWMRTAAMPTFRKLYRIIQNPLKPGVTYRIKVFDRFPVKDFNGKKSIVISTASWVGGKNTFLGTAYIVVGAICLFLGTLFLIKHLKSPRLLADFNYLHFNESNRRQ